MSIWKWSHAGIFAAGMVFATKGVEALASKTAHKVYVQSTAAVLRCRDQIMTGVTSVREGCEDIYAEAVELNEELANAPEVEVKVIEDKSEAKEEKAEKKAKKPARRAKKAE